MMENKSTFPAGLYITLIADASFCHTTKAYGWCYWMKHGSPAQTVICDGGGVGLKNSNEAEVMALREGIKAVAELAGELAGKYVVVQSDCTGALTIVENDIAALVTAGAKRAYSKHVPGHKGHVTPRNSVNTTCDRRAGKQMNKFREQVRNA